MSLEETPPPDLLVIHVLQDGDGNECPRCGSFWMTPNNDSGNPLDVPNRPKVDDWWKCCNKDCPVSYYHPESGATEE